MKVKLLSSTPNAKRVAFAAIRSCYSPTNAEKLFSEEFDKYAAREGDDVMRLINEIVNHGHTSTLEHITFTFAIEDLSRACLGQLTRHRVGWSYSVQSQRYVKQSRKSKHGEAGFVYPTLQYLDSDKRDRAGRILGNVVNVCQDSYDSLVALGVKAEDARSVLPINCTCNLTVSCNLRAFLDFWSKRKPGTHAQEEIQELALKMKDAIINKEPWIEGLIKG